MKKAYGFTLIEIMIVIAIIGILAAIAIPNYNDYVLKGKLAEASATLSDLRVQMEQYYQDNRTYVGGPCAPAVATSVKYFGYACASGEPTVSTFRIVATGAGGSGHVPNTYVFDIDQNNTKRTTGFPGASGLPKNCWITSKSQSC